MRTDPEYGISIQVEIDVNDDLPLDRLKTAVARTLDAHQVPVGAELSIVVTDDATLRTLNQQYRAVDASTDVLSFPADPTPLPDGEVEDDHYLGDLVLALPYIKRQAAAEEHTLSDELTLVVIHGTLHLLGYDHDTATHQATMWAMQADLLRALDVPISVPKFEFDDDEQED